MKDRLPFAVAVLLTWLAGFVDAVGFLSLGHIYTANMSGNSVSVGIQAFWQNWPEMFRRVWPVLCYFVGLLACRIIVEFGARTRIRSIASVAFVLEIGLLTPIFLSQPPHENFGISLVYIALMALAMGIQNAALTHFSSLTLHTGFVTGTLVKCAEELTKYLTWAFDWVRKPGRRLNGLLAESPRQKSFRVALWLAFIWLAYVTGACCGAFGHFAWQMKSLAVPIVALILLLPVDHRYPLAIRDEQDQAKLST